MRLFYTMALVVMTSASFAHAQYFNVGDQVIYQDRYTGIKGTVVEIEPNGALDIDFEDDIHNSVYSHQVDASRLHRYQHVDQLIVRNFVYLQLFTLHVGQKVIYKDFVTWMKGTVVDLTADGLALVDFNDQIHNSVYGRYISAYWYLSPDKDAGSVDGIKSAVPL